MDATQYRLNAERVLFVSDGISGGRTWFTAWRKPSGSSRRFITPHLPQRKTRDEAQADLDRFALARRLKAVEVTNGR
jgi:hemolysin-activating ACP:hemolysin acyltransferase